MSEAYLVDGVRTAVGRHGGALAGIRPDDLAALVVGETVGISTGLGAMITQARDMSKTDLIVAGMVIIGLAGFVADRVLVGLVKLVTRSRPTLS